MSVFPTKWAWEHSQSKGAARLVLLALADIASDEGEITAYPRSKRRLMAMTALSREGIRKAVGELVQIGELVVLRQGDGRNPSNYQIIMREPNDVAPRGQQSGPLAPTELPPGANVVGPHQPILVPPTPPSPKTRAARADYPDEFEALWRRFPRHTAKGAAFKAWQKLNEFDQIATVDGADRYAADPNLPEPQFIPHLATWLNQRRWEDGPLPPRARREDRQTDARRALIADLRGKMDAI